MQIHMRLLTGISGVTTINLFLPKPLDCLESTMQKPKVIIVPDDLLLKLLQLYDVFCSVLQTVPASSCIIGWTCWWKKMANNITRPSTCCFFWPTIAIFLGQHTIPIIIPMGGKPNWKCACVHRGRWCHLRSEPPSPPSPTRLICLVALDHLWVISILRWQVKSFRWIICHVLVRFLRIDAWEIYPAYLFFSKFLHVLSESIGK
jgi:hypothetical protein